MIKTKNVVAIFTIIAILSFVFGSTVIFADTSADNDVAIDGDNGFDTVNSMDEENGVNGMDGVNGITGLDFSVQSEDDDSKVSFGINIVGGPGEVLVKTVSGNVLYSITASGTYAFDMGAKITLEAIPADRFEKWTGQAVSGNVSDNPITLILNSKNMQIVAHFKPAPKMHTLTTGVEGEGIISPSTQQYEEGTKVAIIATAAPGWHFKGWKEGEDPRCRRRLLKYQLKKFRKAVSI